MSVAPESTITVAGKEGVCFLVGMTGLKLAVLVNGSLDLDFLKKYEC